jgi:hypothetical protein
VNSFVADLRNMKRIILHLTCVFLFSQATFAQNTVVDSVTTDGSTLDVYYSLQDGVVKSEPNENWDLAFTTRLIDAAVLVNDVKGVEAYIVSNDINDWNNLDTTGKFTTRLYNNDTSWAIGALGNTGASHPDYGWGTYNQVTRNVNGSRIFVLKLKDGSFKKFMIESMATNGMWTFKIADLDGANELTKTVNKNDYREKNFVYYDIDGDQFVDREPASSSWDIVFTKYMSAINTGPGGIVYYPLTAALINLNTENAERRSVATSSDDTSSLNWNTNITEIGGDWKSFNRTSFQWEFEEDLTYFVRTADGVVYKLFFTNYIGSTTGRFIFSKKNITGTAGLSFEESRLQAKVYPNPTTSAVNIQADRINDIKLLSNTGALLGEWSFHSVNQAVIELDAYPSGVYYLQITGESGIAHQALMIQP